MADIAAVTSIEITARDLTRGALESVRGGLTQVGNAARSVTGVLGALGVSLSAAAFTVAIKNAIDYADQLNDLAKRTGIAVETLGGLGYAAEQSGTSLEAVAKGTSRLATVMAEAAAGGGKATAVFDAMGLSVKGLDGNLKPLDQMLGELADRFTGYEDGAAKAALANQIFGEKLGAQLIPFLNEGGEKIRAMVEEYRKYGGITTETAQRADAFNDTLAKINLMGSALWRTLASALLPTLQAVANIFVESKEKAGGFQEVAEGVTVAVKGLAIGALAVVEAFKALGGSIGTVFGAIAAYLRGDSLASIWDGLKQGFGDVSKSVAAAYANMEKVVNASTASIATGTSKNLANAKAPVAALGAETKKTADLAKEMNAEFKRLYDQAQSNIQAVEDLWEAEEKLNAEIAAASTAMASYVGAQFDAVRAYDEQTAAIGRTRQELAEMDLARQREIRDLRLMAGWGQEAIDIYDQWVAAMNRREVALAQQEQTQAMVGMWKEVDAAAQDAFTNILQGGKGAFDRLKDSLLNGLYALLYQMTVRPFIINIAASLTGNPNLATALGGALGGGSGALGGGGDILSLLSGGSSLLGGGGTLFGSSLAGGGIFSSGLGASFATSALGESLGLSVAMGMGEGMALTALGSMLGTAIPVIGAVLAIATMMGAFDRDPSQVRGRFGITSGSGGFEDNASLSTLFGNIGFLDEGTQYFSGEAAQVFNQVIADTLSAIGSRLDDAGVARLTERLQGTDFGSFEGEYTTQEFIERYGAEIMGKVISAGLAEIDPALQRVFDAFEGTADEMAEFANVLLTVHDLTQSIPEDLRETLIGALDGTVEMSEQVVAFAAAYSVLQEVLNSDPVADALEAIADASGSAYEALSRQADAFGELIAAYDGTAEASQEIAEATAGYYNALVSVIAGIRQLGASIESMFGQTIEDLTLETMTDDEKKVFYQSRISDLYGQLAGATDPAEIERISRQINEYMRAAFGLLSPDEQTNLLQQYADYARQVNDLAQERLQLAEDAAQARADALFLQLRDVMTAAANDFRTAAGDQKAAAADQRAAASTMLQAANTPIVIVSTDSPVNA